MSTAVMESETELERVEEADVRRAGAAPPKKRPKAKLVLGALAVTFATIGAAAWLAGRGKQSTDDAFVEAHVASVAARIQGQVVRVDVKDNQLVEVGDALVAIDDRDAKVRLATAEADLLSAKANLAAFETQLALTEKNIAATLRAGEGRRRPGVGARRLVARHDRSGQGRRRRRGLERALAELDLRRTEKLHGDGAVAQADLDAKRALFDQAVAQVAQARARQESALVGLTNAAGSIETAQGRLAAANAGPEQVEAARAAVAVAAARVAQAEAVVEQAKLALSYTEVKAQVRGVVSRRSVEVGQTVDPSRPLMAITALDDVWIVANFKEDQIAQIAPGQTATIEVDAFHGRKLTGHVDSLSGGSGARFSLLPPDNASGNFTKVVQRIPVLVRFDEPPKDITLRPGMSTYITVHTAR